MAKLTPTQKAYQKEIANLRRRIRTAQKTGFVFDQLPIPTKPSRITKREIEKVKSLRGISLYEQAVGFQSMYFGEFFSAAEVVQNLKKERARRAAITKWKNKLVPIGFVGPYANQGMIALQKLEDWIASYAPPSYQGKRPRNARWEYVMDVQQRAHDTIEEMVEIVKERLADLYYQTHDDDSPINVDKFITREIANRIINSGINMDEAIEGMQRASKEEDITRFANPIIAALQGHPLSIYDRQRIATYTNEDITDFTDPDKFPL